MLCHVPGGARCVVSVLQYSLVGPGVKRLYALDTPIKKYEYLINIRFNSFRLCYVLWDFGVQMLSTFDPKEISLADVQES